MDSSSPVKLENPQAAEPRPAHRRGMLAGMAAPAPLIRRIAPGDPVDTDGLCALLVDAVSGGASVGFLAPLDHARARHYWSGVLADLGPALGLWVAEIDGRVVGSVQFTASTRENGRHRAEVQKLFVLRCHRGRGIATRLMAALEAAARQDARTLLVLDTEAGSGAEAFYVRHGWQRVGEIPDYAADPAGALHPTALYYKRL